jgi:hypothetical protein
VFGVEQVFGVPEHDFQWEGSLCPRRHYCGK